MHAYDLGFRREYERLQQKNPATITKARVRRLVIACGSCRRVWREHAKVAVAGLEVLHGVEYLGAALRMGQLKITKLIRKSYLSRFLSFGERFRHIPSAAQRLGAIPGVQVVEMKRNQRSAWCCSGGVSEADPNLARWCATETGAQRVLTSSALSQRSFNALEQSALPTQELFEFVGQAV